MVLPHHLFYMRAFNHLARDRPVSPGSVGAIPWSSMNAYGQRTGLRGPAFDLFVEVICTMDNYWLSEQRREMEKEAELQKRAERRRNRRGNSSRWS